MNGCGRTIEGAENEDRSTRDAERAVGKRIRAIGVARDAIECMVSHERSGVTEVRAPIDAPDTGACCTAMSNGIMAAVADNCKFPGRGEDS